MRMNSAKVGAWKSPLFTRTLILTKQRDICSLTATTGSLWSTSSEFFLITYFKVHKKYIIRSVLTTQSLFKFIFAKHFLGVFFFNFLIKILNNRTALAPLSEQQAKFWIKTGMDYGLLINYSNWALNYDETAEHPVGQTFSSNKLSFVCKKFN